MWQQIKNTLMGRKDQNAQNPDTMARVAILDKIGRVQTEPVDPNDQAGFDAAHKLLFDATRRRASDVEVNMGGQMARVTYKIDGVITERDPIERNVAGQLISVFKVFAGLDREERRRPQEGKLLVKALEQTLKFIVQTQGSSQGESLKLKMQSEHDITLRIGDIGLLNRQLEAISEVQKQPGGLFIVAGRRSHGLSTTLYALARAHDAFMLNMFLFERAKLLDLDTIKQIVIPNDTAERTMAAEISRVLGTEPDILLVDPLDNPAAAREIARAVKDGRKCYVTIVQPDVFRAIAQWLKWVGDDKAAAQGIQAVVAQRVLRKLCPACREPYTPDPSLLHKMNLNAEKISTLFRSPGRPKAGPKGEPLICEVCQGTGYFGQSAIYELLVLDDELRKAVATGASKAQMLQLARRNKFQTLQEVGLRRVVEGMTSIQEMLRVTQDDAK